MKNLPTKTEELPLGKLKVYSYALEKINFIK